jgi:hypothetical protein
MEQRSLFISSCTRRQMARRRPGRTPVPHAALLLAVLALAAAVGALLAAHGGL